MTTINEIVRQCEKHEERTVFMDLGLLEFVTLGNHQKSFKIDRVGLKDTLAYFFYDDDNLDISSKYTSSYVNLNLQRFGKGRLSEFNYFLDAPNKEAHRLFENHLDIPHIVENEFVVYSPFGGYDLYKMRHELDDPQFHEPVHVLSANSSRGATTTGLIYCSAVAAKDDFGNAALMHANGTHAHRAILEFLKSQELVRDSTILQHFFNFQGMEKTYPKLWKNYMSISRDIFPQGKSVSADRSCDGAKLSTTSTNFYEAITYA